MAAIEGFTEVQNAALRGVTVGSLLFVQKVVAPAAYDPDGDGDDSEDDQDDGEDEEDGDEGMSDMEQDGDEADNSGSTHSGQTDAVPAHAHPVPAGNTTAHDGNEVDSGMEIARESDTTWVDEDESILPSGNLADDYDVHLAATDSQAAQSQHAGSLTGSHEPEVEMDSTVTDAGISNADTSAQDEATSNDSDEPDEPEVFVPTMYIVSSVIKGDDTGSITELGVTPLTFNHKVGSFHGEHSYHIFGNECKAYHECEGPCEIVTSITTVATGEHFTFMLNPLGDYVRRIVHGPRRCIGTCTDGFLDNTSCLSDMVKDYTPEMLDYEQNVGPVPASLQKPICPVCIGPALLREQQALQRSFMDTSQVDFGLAVEYVAKLNQRRVGVRATMGGYRFVQFDERQWGYGFDDMLESEDDDYDNDGGGHSGQFEHWEEAQDPNANPKLRPASDETIAALPRKQRNEVTFEGDDESCCIDREGFEIDSVLVQLPCGHAKFHEGCIVTWLKQYNNCPICREVIPDVSAEIGEKGPNHKAAMLRMSLGEALTSLGYEAGTCFEAIDKEMLPVVFASARDDRAGWRTETAIARLEAELAVQKEPAEEEADVAGDDIEGSAEQMEVAEGSQHEAATDEDDAAAGGSENVAESQDSIMSDE